MEIVEELDREISPSLEELPEQQLWDAAEHGDLEKLKHCLGLCKIDEADEDNITPLSIAAASGKTAVVSYLLNRGAQGQHPDIVRLLLQYGASTARADALGKTVRDYAKDGGNTEIIDLLASVDTGGATAEVSVLPDGTTFTNEAGPVGETEIAGGSASTSPRAQLDTLPVTTQRVPSPYLSADTSVAASVAASVAHPHPVGHAFIESIAAHGDAVQVSGALSADKNLVNATDDDSNTPLLAAAHMGHTAIVKLLLQSGAHVNHSNASSGWTALHAASARGYDDVVVLLLRNGADKSLVDHKGKTPSAYARAFDHTSTVKLLDGFTTTPSKGAACTATATVIAIAIAALAVALFYLLGNTRS